MANIGENIENLRKRQAKSKKEVAHAADIRPESLGRIERGAVVPRRDTLERIARALDVDIGVLLAESGVDTGGEMGRAVLGTRQVPVGYSVLIPEKSDNLQILQLALAQLCSLEISGRVTTEERKTFQHLVARLEGYDVDQK